MTAITSLPNLLCMSMIYCTYSFALVQASLSSKESRRRATWAAATCLRSLATRSLATRSPAMRRCSSRCRRRPWWWWRSRAWWAPWALWARCPWRSRAPAAGRRSPRTSRTTWACSPGSSACCSSSSGALSLPQLLSLPLTHSHTFFSLSLSHIYIYIYIKREREREYYSLSHLSFLRR